MDYSGDFSSSVSSPKLAFTFLSFTLTPRTLNRCTSLYLDSISTHLNVIFALFPNLLVVVQTSHLSHLFYISKQRKLIEREGEFGRLLLCWEGEI